MPSAIIDAAKLDWHSNTKGKWTAFVDDLDTGTPVFDRGYTFTVSGSSITVESDRRPSGVLEYPSTDTNIAPVKELMGTGCNYGYIGAGWNQTGSVGYNDTLDLAKGKSVKQIYKNVMRGSSISQWNGNPSSQFGRTVAGALSTGAATNSPTITGVSNRFRTYSYNIWSNGADNNAALASFSSFTSAALRFSAQMLGVDDLRVYTVDQVLAMCKQYAEDQYEAGDPITLYISYRLASKVVKTDVAPLPLELSHGFNAVVAEDSTTTTNYFEATYDAYEWDEVTYQGCVYLHRHNGVDTRVTGAMNTKKTEHVAAGDMLVNLTLWFGNNTGAVPSNAVFYTLFPQWKHQIPPYDEGTLLNYKGTGIRTIGFNAYNPATGTAVLLGGHEYQICGTYTAVSYTDQWGDPEELTLDDHGIFTPLNDGTLTVEGGNSTDTCVHLCWSGYKNYGEPEYKWEPYTELEQSWDLSPFFPDGLNGRAGVFDEMTADERTVRWRKHVFDGTESLPAYGTNTLYWANAEIASAQEFAACNLLAPTHITASPTEQYRASLDVSAGRIYLQGIYFLAGAEHSLNPVGDVVAWMKARYAAGNPLFVVYPIKTPEVSAVSNAQNFTYNVNDFGTEQSLPVNTVELLSADMNVQIRYSEDFTRLLVHYSDMYPELSALAKEEKAGQIMRIDDTAQNAYNLIDRNAAGTERQFSFDTSGGTQDIADGTAVAKKVMGTTLNLNQLVHDTNENTVESVDGNATVSDAVGGQVKHLVVSGDTVVVNQLVHEYVEKTDSGTGRIWIKDAFEKEAKGLKVTAPRSVVMNQLVQNGNFSDGTTGWTSSRVVLSASDGVLTLTFEEASSGYGTNATHIVSFVTGHKVIASALLNTSWTHEVQFGIGQSNETTTPITVIPANTWTRLTFIGQVPSGSNRVQLFPSKGNSAAITVGSTVSMKEVSVIDLTQYFNGNQTIIDSIQTWDDLVAYDSAFASYVQYNTGTVKGVTPALTLNGAAQPFATAPQEMFGVGTIRDEWSVVDGKYTQKMGVVDLGTLNWNYITDDPNAPFFSSESISDAVHITWTTQVANFVCAKYVCDRTSYDTIHPYTDKRISGFGQRARVTDSSYTDAATFKAAMSGVMLYYELVTPVVTDVTPVAFDLVSHDNTIFQTSGDLQAGIEATYDGLNQTIALDPAHTYAFNHQYVEDSIITGESSIDCVGTEDNLVDLTQLYAGDATRIAQIHSWASLSSRIHMYRDWLPYNPGEIVNLSATIRVYQHEHAYGVVYDPSQSSPVCQRVELNDGVITEVEEFTSLPAHNFKRCVMDDLATRHVNYYLDPLDSTKKADGTPSVLTGADGDVMVEIPITHWYIDEDYNGEGKVLWLVSDQPFTGSEIHPYFYVGPGGDTARTQYVGAYRASVCDENGVALNTIEGALTQITGGANTNKVRSVAGALPYSASIGNMREASIRNGGTLTNLLFREYIYMMFVVEMATLNSQSISLGYTYGKTYSFWGYRKAGRVNYGNGTGQLLAVSYSQDDDNFYSLKVNNVQLYRDAENDANGYFAWSNHAAIVTRYFTESATPGYGATAYSDSNGTDSGYTTTSWSSIADANKVIQFQYRGIENLWGEVWEFVDGVQKYQANKRTHIIVNNITYYLNCLKNGSGSKTAWTSEDGLSTVWTTINNVSTGASVYADSECTVITDNKVSSVGILYMDYELWHTSNSQDYTSTVQRSAETKAYNKKYHFWPESGYIKTFSQETFLPRTIGGNSSTYIGDVVTNNAAGNKTVMFGGNISGGSAGGFIGMQTTFGLLQYGVDYGGRTSA